VSRLIATLCIACLITLGCASEWARTDEGTCVILTLADVRIVDRGCRASNASLRSEKHAASPEFLDKVEKAVAAGVKIGLACAGLGAASSLVDACKLPLPSGDEIPTPVEE